jgi:ribosomal protein S18 acetylase RimI-like enzyme
MNSEIVLRKLELADLPQVAQVHINSFPDSALTKLGAPIVERYYLWQLTGPHEKVWATGAFVAGDCAGFSFGGIFNGSTGGFVRQNKAFLIKETLRQPQLLFNRSFLQRVQMGIKSLRRLSRKKSASTNEVRLPQISSFGILSIGVSERYQKLGIGKLLMLDAEKEAVRCGYKQMDLSVHPTNEKAVGFYEKQNWQRFPSNDFWKGVMIKPLK